MARRPILGGGSLTPFGTGGVDFGAFNIVDPGQEAYLAFLKVQTAYEAGRASDDEYLAALEVYANAQPANSTDRVSLMARLERTRWTVQRNVLVHRIENNEASIDDLVAFDDSMLAGLDTDSEEYRDRLNAYRNSLGRWFGDLEEAIVDRYSQGLMTTAQLDSWYREAMLIPELERHPELRGSLQERIDELARRLLDERDAQAIDDYADGRVSTGDFLTYATAAQSRYAEGTEQSKQWQDRITQARDNQAETELLYRYGLSQQYAELSRFVAENSAKVAAGSTSTSKRIVLGADGQWKTVETTKYSAPSEAERAAYARLQIEIADAKRQMTEIARQSGGVGGWVETVEVMTYYQRQQVRYVKGSPDWYRVQEKIDSLNDRLHAEQVYGQQGIRVTYPGAGASAGAGGGGSGAAPTPRVGAGSGTTLDAFMAAIAQVESGGRYDARNATTGAYGKYQILPSNWSAYAQKAGLPANAPQTPANQEIVARNAFERYQKSYGGDWSMMAAAWHAGVSGARGSWGPNTSRYVNNVMSALGQPGVRAPAAPSSPAAPSQPGRNLAPGAPLRQITSATTTRRTGAEAIQTVSAGFPVNLDGEAFRKFYANYERAFASGAESFVDTSSGRSIAYFIGDDADERIGRMRQLDDLRVRYFQTRAEVYAGTPSEIEAANQLNNSIQDAAKHEYQILATQSRSTIAVPQSVNPIAAGLRLLDKQKDGIALELRLAKEAWQRSDVTAAYRHLQLADRLLQPSIDPRTGEPFGKVANLAGYASAAEQAIAAINAAYGGITLEEAGAEGIAGDLERLRNWNTELTDLFDQGGDLSGVAIKNEIQKVIRTDSAGRPIFDDPYTPKGKLVLAEGYQRYVTPEGKIEIKRAPVTGVDPQTGQRLRDAEGRVMTSVRVGNSVEEALAQYEIGSVGAFVDPLNPAVRYKIEGKIVSYVDPITGRETTFYENPMSPNSWSSTPITIQAPRGFKSTVSADGKTTAYQFIVTERVGRGGSQPVGGWTYGLQLDPDTGVYMVVRSRPGGLFQAEVKGEIIGHGLDADVATLFQDAGFSRITTGLAGDDLAFADLERPALGFTADQWRDYNRNFQPPALAARARRAGSLPPGHQAETDVYRKSVPSMLVPPDARDSATMLARAVRATRPAAPLPGQRGEADLYREQPRAPLPEQTRFAALPPIRPPAPQANPIPIPTPAPAPAPVMPNQTQLGGTPTTRTKDDYRAPLPVIKPPAAKPYTSTQPPRTPLPGGTRL